MSGCNSQVFRSWGEASAIFAKFNARIRLYQACSSGSSCGSWRKQGGNTDAREWDPGILLTRILPPFVAKALNWEPRPDSRGV